MQRTTAPTKARGISVGLIRWVKAFCLERTATIQINGHVSEVQGLPQAGLPQGSSLSPMLFLFFNADLVQRQIDSQGGAMAFVDDFTACVTGSTAQSNREGIEAIINEALDWEKRSGATFEADKTAIIHFALKDYKLDQGPFTIEGQTVEPKGHVRSWASSWTRNSGTRNILRGQHPRAWKPPWGFEDFGVYPQRQRDSYLYRQWRRSWTTSQCLDARVQG